MNLKKLGKWIISILSLIIANGASVSWLVMNCINVAPNSDLEISYWDVLNSKAVYKLVEGLTEFNLPEYHFYNKLLVYIFMFLGALITFFSIKFFIKRWLSNKDFQRENKEKRKMIYEEYELKNKLTKEEKINLLEKKIKNGIISEKEFEKELKKLEKELS